MTIDINRQIKILMRGVVYPEKQLDDRMRTELVERLEKKGKLKAYLGVDPTTPALHLGHIVAIQKLKHFQDMGHETIFLIGDFTGMIGDPTGVSAARLQRTRDEVLECAKTYTDQAFKILDPKKTKIAYNSEWLSPLTFDKAIKLASKLTLARILSHEDFKKRYENGVPVCLHEMLYCLMQGYDALVLDVDVQVGGTDQLFNMLVGRTFQEDAGKLPHIPVTTPILIGTDGIRKMSQSYGNDIRLTAHSEDMYGKLMSIPDHLLPSYFELLTNITIEEIQDMTITMEKGVLNPRDAKMRLAKEIVSRFHGGEEAEKAEEHFVRVFQKRLTPEEIPNVRITDKKEGEEVPLVDFLVKHNLLSSKGEARRLIEQRGIYINDKQITGRDSVIRLENGLIIRIGRKKYYKLII